MYSCKHFIVIMFDSQKQQPSHDGSTQSESPNLKVIFIATYNKCTCFID